MQIKGLATRRIPGVQMKGLSDIPGVLFKIQA